MLVQVGEGVHRVSGGVTNFYLIEENGKDTVVDAGAPRDWALLESSLRGLGAKPEDLDAGPPHARSHPGQRRHRGRKAQRALDRRCHVHLESRHRPGRPADHAIRAEHEQRPGDGLSGCPTCCHRRRVASGARRPLHRRRPRSGPTSRSRLPLEPALPRHRTPTCTPRRVGPDCPGPAPTRMPARPRLLPPLRPRTPKRPPLWPHVRLRSRKRPGLDKLARGRLVGRTRAERRAPPGNAASAARGPSGATDTTTVPDHPVGKPPSTPGKAAARRRRARSCPGRSARSSQTAALGGQNGCPPRCPACRRHRRGPRWRSCGQRPAR